MPPYAYTLPTCPKSWWHFQIAKRLVQSQGQSQMESLGQIVLHGPRILVEQFLVLLQLPPCNVMLWGWAGWCNKYWQCWDIDDILWYIMIYYDILWYIMIYCLFFVFEWTPQGGLQQRDLGMFPFAQWIVDSGSGTGQERVLRLGGRLGPWLARRCSAWSVSVAC